MHIHRLLNLCQPLLVNTLLIKQLYTCTEDSMCIYEYMYNVLYVPTLKWINYYLRMYKCEFIVMVDALVPTPTVSMTALNTQIVGQSVTLKCEVTTVRGITSRVDIVWSSDGIELERMNNVSSTTINNSLVYTIKYTIPQLSTADDDRVIQCEGVINATLPVMANDSIALDVTGM